MTAILRASSILVLIFFSLTALISIFFGSDSLGTWSRVTGWGSLAGLLLACGSVLVDLIRRQPPCWIRAQVLMSASILLCFATFTCCSAVMANDIEHSLNHAESYIGCVEIHLRGRSGFIVCPADDTADSSVAFRVRRTQPLPLKTVTSVRAAEDMRQPYGLTPSDPHGVARAVRHLGKQGGGSGLCQQLARIGLHAKREGTRAQQFFNKAKVFVGCDALDGTITRDRQMQLYADLVNLGNVGVANIQGLAAASQILYGKPLEDLTWHENFELASLINAPTRMFPLQRPGEPFVKAATRQEALRKHFDNVVENARRNHLVTNAEADQAEREFGTTFVSADRLPDVLPPTVRLLRAAVGAEVPDHSSRFLQVESDYDPAAQIAVQAGIAEGLAKVAPLLPTNERDLLQADVAVLDADGSEVALANLATVPSDLASVQKVQLYAFALQRHCLASMQSIVDGTTAAIALAKSDNRAAQAVATCAGPHGYAQFLGLQGWKITNPALIELTGYESVATGSGISASPVQVAAMGRMFNPAHHPGVLVEPSFLVSVTDAANGKLLYQPASRDVVSPAIADEINHALRGTAIVGTTRHVLADLAKRDPALISKTGTSTFKRNGVLHGGGGSWIVVGDDRYSLAVRVELNGGHTIGLEGAVAAGPVAASILSNLRQLSNPQPEGANR